MIWLALAFALVGAAEVLWPRQTPTALTRIRWVGNLALLALTAIGAVLLPGFDPADAATMEVVPWAWPRTGLTGWLALGLGVLALDLLGYVQHRLFHAVPPLWRLHAVHHSDTELDITTTLRQHPLAVLLTGILFAAGVVGLGLPVAAYAVYRSLELVVQMAAHANIRLPEPLARSERLVGRWLVTPAFHQLHHSPWMAETNANYGQVLAIWDRLFGTARMRALGEVRAPEFGLSAFRDRRFERLDMLLAQPFLPRRTVR